MAVNWFYEGALWSHTHRMLFFSNTTLGVPCLESLKSQTDQPVTAEACGIFLAWPGIPSLGFSKVPRWESALPMGARSLAELPGPLEFLGFF